MRILKHILLIAALSLALISCEDEVTNNYFTEAGPKGIGVNVIGSEYYLKTVHRSYLDTSYVDYGGSSYSWNYSMGLNIKFKLDDPSKRETVNRMTLRNTMLSYPLSFDFKKDELNAAYVESLGGYMFDIDIFSLYFYPDYGNPQGDYDFYDFEWEIVLYDASNRPSETFRTVTKTGDYIGGVQLYNDWEIPARLKIIYNKQEVSAFITPTKGKISLYSLQKEKLSEYSFENAGASSDTLTIGNVSADASYYTAELEDTKGGIRRIFKSGYIILDR